MMGFDLRAAKAAWTVFLIVLSLYVLYLIHQTLTLFAFAILFAYMIYPLVRVLGWRRRDEPPGIMPTTAAFVLVIALLVTAGAFLGARMAEQASALAQQLPRVLSDPHWLEKIPVPDWLNPVRARLAGLVEQQIQRGAQNTLPLIQDVGTKVLRFGSNLIFLVLVPILSFMFIQQAHAIRAALQRWLMASPDYAAWDGIIEDVNRMLKHYIRTLFVLSLATFIAYSGFLSLIGMPYSLLLAGIAAFLEFIPLLGPLAAAVIIFVVAGVTGYAHWLWILAFIAAYRVFQDYVLSPYLMGEGVEVHPLLVIFGILAGDQIAGIVGMFFAIPVLAALKIIATHVRFAR